MIGTFLPIQYYLPPILLTYTLTNFLTYHYQTQKDLCYDSFCVTILSNLIISSAAAYIIHIVVDEAFDSSRRIVQVVGEEGGALVVLDEAFELVFCTKKAEALLKFGEG